MKNSFYHGEFPDITLRLGKEDLLKSLWITLNNPQHANCLTDKMLSSLKDVLSYADTDSDISVIVLTGAGKSFCAGGDLAAMQNKTGMFAGEVNTLREKYHSGIQSLPRTIEAMQTPLIAMVAGAAIGAGSDLACMCDMRVGSNHAKFAVTFNRLGLVPGDGGTYFLQRVIGYAKAMELFFTARVVKADEAYQLDLLNYPPCDAASLQTKTEELVMLILKNSPVATNLTKLAIKAAYNSQNINQHLDLLSAYQGIAQRSHDHVEALEAYLSKGSAQYKNE